MGSVDDTKSFYKTQNEKMIPEEIGFKRGVYGAFNMFAGIDQD